MDRSLLSEHLCRSIRRKRGTMFHFNRADGALEKLKALGISQAFIYESVAVYYFVGESFYAGERFVGLLLKSDGNHKLFLNKTNSFNEDPGIEVVWLDDADDALSIFAESLDADSPLGVDKELPAKFLLPMMEAHPSMKFINASPAVDAQRQVKDAQEQAMMFENSQINDAAMEQFKKLIVPGITELEIQERMQDIYKSLGAESMLFGIVAFGKNAADAHHSTDHTILQEGDCVLLDVGASKYHYCSDMTRTFFYRTVSEKQREVYNVVRMANEEAEKAVRAGERYCDIDAVARKVITDAGYGKYFTHRLGHGIGLTDHEPGDASSINKQRIPAGAFFSIEPGIYLPGEFGVRIEDLVMATDDGCRVLNKYSKDLEIIP